MSSVHQRAKEVFIAALDLSPAERQAFIAGACGDDAELRREAESLLEFHEEEAFDEDITHAGAPTLDDLQLGPGHVIADRYRLTRRIGRGGMGDVWEATDLVLLTPVALKFIGSADRAARHRIANEVRLARQITHPAVCRVFDVGETDRGLF
jgi:hypothetical protein